MPKPIKELKTHTLKTMYQEYVTRLLKDNPTWWGIRDEGIRMKNYTIYAKSTKKKSKWVQTGDEEEGDIVIKMSWPLYRTVVESYFHKAKDAIIQGESLTLTGVGKIRAIRAQRNFKKPTIDWAGTLKDKQVDEKGKTIFVYHTSEDYCKIEWVKDTSSAGGNVRSYHFMPANGNTLNKKGFKKEFTTALMRDPLLKYRYKYNPLLDIKALALCNTNTPVSEPL